MNQILFGALCFFVSTIIMVLVHEAGHFFAAKAFGVKVSEFAVGMGPKLLYKQHKGVLYSLRLFPIGGYCAFSDPDDNAFDKAVGDKYLYNVEPWKRALVSLAGPVVNILTGAIIILIMTRGNVPMLWESITTTITGVFEGIKELVHVENLTKGGMVTTSLTVGEMVGGNIRMFWATCGVVSLFLGFFNLVPYPALDGFSAVWALAETITNKRFGEVLENRIKFIGMVVIYTVTLIIMLSDFWTVPQWFMNH